MFSFVQLFCSFLLFTSLTPPAPSLPLESWEYPPTVYPGGEEYTQYTLPHSSLPHSSLRSPYSPCTVTKLMPYRLRRVSSEVDEVVEVVRRPREEWGREEMVEVVRRPGEEWGREELVEVVRRPGTKLSRDERAASALRIPFTVSAVISSSMEEFGEMLNSWWVVLFFTEIFNLVFLV